MVTLERGRFLVSQLILVSFSPVWAWHELDNSQFHCWPLINPDAKNYLHDCHGLTMAWLADPPTEVRSSDNFIVNFTIQVTDSFFEWAVRNDTDYAIEYKPVFHPDLKFNNGLEARRWCVHNPCPARKSDADQYNCCFHHVNVHSCPKDKVSISTALSVHRCVSSSTAFQQVTRVKGVTFDQISAIPTLCNVRVGAFNRSVNKPELVFSNLVYPSS
ncbi:uncharacterized protein LOC119727915 [Patiria miniata]|uniref:Uncharacterized protein n=1 Tax=Patiria miniata TaxID=46514 RepID=A0A913ZWM0_PATMI|nr:uncharacterized protein LOC119727915 [Patiria miniata]